MEQEWWPLLEGRWAGEGGPAFRLGWRERTRAAGSVRQLAQRLLELEGAVRDVALKDEFRAPPGAAAAAQAAALAAAQRTPSDSRAISRAASGVDLAADGGGRLDSQEPEDSGAGDARGSGAEPEVLPFKPHALSAAARASDPYDVRYEKVREGPVRAPEVGPRRYGMGPTRDAGSACKGRRECGRAHSMRSPAPLRPFPNALPHPTCTYPHPTRP